MTLRTLLVFLLLAQVSSTQSAWRPSPPTAFALEKQFGQTTVAVSDSNEADPGGVLLLLGTFDGESPLGLEVYTFEGIDEAGIDIRKRAFIITPSVKNHFESLRSSKEYDRLSALHLATLLAESKQSDASMKDQRFRLPLPDTSFRVRAPMVERTIRLTILIRRTLDTTLTAKLRE